MVGETKTGGIAETPGDPLTFTAADRVIRLVGALYQRPRFGDRPRELDENSGEWSRVWERAQRQARQGLPMLNLIHPGGPPGILRAVAGMLAEAHPHGVRHALVTPPDSPPTSRSGGELRSTTDVEVIRQILLDTRHELINSPRVHGSQPRFPLFSLVVFLMNNKRKSEDLNLEVALLRDLQELGFYWRFRNITNAVRKEMGEQKLRWKLLVLITQALTWLLFRGAVTGRIPVLSGRYRWFLRQPHLAPEMSGTFVRFATRLTAGEWQKEAPEYVARLLVNTFLEDLRRTYRLRPWQIFRQRRMTYPVLLLDDITPTNGGYTLLRLINDVRNQIGAFDPLLVVSASEAAPPTSATSQRSRGGFSTDKAYVGYRVWQNELLKDRRARQPTTWYLPIWVPRSTPQAAADEARDRLKAFHRFSMEGRAARPVLLTSRWLRLGLVTVVLAGAAAGVLVWRHGHCESWNPALTFTGTECVGVTDGSYDIFQPSDATIQQVEQRIYQQNQLAAQLHADNPQRPYITIADVESDTSSTGTADGLTGEREAVEGVAVAQWRQLNKSGSADPIVRVLLGNAGRDMRQGVLVARSLSALAATDPSLVGVVSLDRSSQPTVDTINALANAGLPMVAATLSADSLAASNPMYFQVAPQDSREAAVAAAFADQQQRQNPGTARTVRVYYSDDASDIYSGNLRDDVLKAFQAKGFGVSAVAFTPSGFTGPTWHQAKNDPLAGNAHAAGQDACSQDGFVYFAGRGVPDYGDFLDGANQCVSKAVFLGDDDVTRYVANATLREQYRGLSYYYVSFGPAPINTPSGPERDFYTTLNNLFAFEQDQQQNRSLDPHAALSYDASEVLITATEYLRADSANLPVTAGNVWREITDIHTSAEPGNNKYLEGVTGAIDFGGDITRHVPLDKTVAILRVSDGEVEPDLIGFCGDANGHQQSPWCPSGS